MRLCKTWLSKLTMVGLLSTSLCACHQSNQNIRPDYPAGGDGAAVTSYPPNDPAAESQVYGGGSRADDGLGWFAAGRNASSSRHVHRLRLRTSGCNKRRMLGARSSVPVWAPSTAKIATHRFAMCRLSEAARAPLFLGSLHYNDSQGAEAQRDRLIRRYYPGEPVWRTFAGNRPTPWVGVTVAIVDESGQPLPSYHLANHILVVGAAGQRYAIQVENRTGQRFELVASVDGQDVVDGRSASLDKRGYVVDAFHRIRIDGFRRSMSEVAAFRFGSVRNSYAAKTSEFGDRNVGVIGVALFGEQGAPLPAYGPDLDDEARRREGADPFPGRFAPPPPPAPRPYY
jgi:hypothetical protein